MQATVNMEQAIAADGLLSKSFDAGGYYLTGSLFRVLLAPQLDWIDS